MIEVLFVLDLSMTRSDWALLIQTVHYLMWAPLVVSRPLQDNSLRHHIGNHTGAYSFACEPESRTSNFSRVRYLSCRGSKRASMVGLSNVNFLCSCTASASMSRVVGGRRSATVLVWKYSCSACSSLRAMKFSRPVKLARHASQCPTKACHKQQLCMKLLC